MTGLRYVIAQLRLTPVRTLSLCVSVAAALTVVLLLEGFRTGLLDQMRLAVLERGADLVAAQPGVSNFLISRSKLPQFSRAEIEAVEGVSVAAPITFVPLIYERDGRKNPVFMIVHQDVGGPVRLSRGHRIDGPRQIVIDESLAAMYGLGPGDSFTVSDFTFRVIGVSAGSVAMFTPFAFIGYDDLIDFYFEADMGDVSTLPLLSFLLIKTDAGRDRMIVAARIREQVPAVDVYLPETLAANDAGMGASLFGPVLDVLLTVSYGICLLVITIIVYWSASIRRRSLGVLKAIGFPNRYLAYTLTAEAALVTLGALPLGILLAVGVGRFIEAWAPLYTVSVLQPDILVKTAAATLVLSVLGALAPFGMVARLEPSLVFRS